MTLKKPFDATTLPALIMKIMKGSFDPVPNIYSLELKKLLLSMLNLDPNQRPSAAQIMSHPVMLKIIFKLYLEVGSISLSNRLYNDSISTNLKVSEKHYLSVNPVPFNTQRRRSSSVTKFSPSVWFFDEKTEHSHLLSPPPKDVIKYVSLGLNHKTGITKSGLLVSWRTCPELLISKNSDSEESVLSSSNIAYIIDEKIAINIVSVVCGIDFTICLSDNGVVFSFGKVSSGCLGLSTKKDIEQPKIIEALFNHHIRAIDSGPSHVLAISEENDVYSWGYNSGLGLGVKQLQILPELVPIISESKPEKIFCGIDCSFIILNNKSVMASGSNRHNKLAMDSGDGHQVEEVRHFTPIQSEFFSSHRIVSLSSGKAHSVFLCENGEVYSVGSNRYYQLGWGNPGIDYSMPQRVEKLVDVKIAQVKCGDFFTLAISNDNYMYCWGKCPRPLRKDNELTFCDVEIPSTFKNKCVSSFSCYSGNCIVIEEDC